MSDEHEPVDSNPTGTKWNIANVDRALSNQNALWSDFTNKARELAELLDSVHLDFVELAQALPSLVPHLAEIESSPDRVTGQDVLRAYDEVVRATADRREAFERFEQSLSETEDDVRFLAKLGWTLPLWGDIFFAHRVSHSVSREPVGEEVINRTFEEHYTRDRGIEFEKLRQDLVGCPGLKQWRDTIIECFECYDLEKYQVIAPTLLAVIEGAVMTATGKSRKKPTPAAASRRKSAVNVVDSLIWMSIEQYVYDLFRDSPFTGPEPVTLNRNWTVHGRSSRKITRLDCMKLFHSLHTITNEIDDPEV